MIYLQSFQMLSKIKDEDFFNVNSSTFKTKNYRTCYSSHYPLVMFRDGGLPDFGFDDITIFYGNNGSGKSTILNTRGFGWLNDKYGVSWQLTLEK